MYDAERMANDLLRQQLAEKDTKIKQLKAVAFQAQNAAIDLNRQLAAGQAREQQLRAHLEVIAGKRPCADNNLGNVDIAELALAIPQDTTALVSELTRACEATRKTSALVAWAWATLDCADDVAAAVRNTPITHNHPQEKSN